MTPFRSALIQASAIAVLAGLALLPTGGARAADESRREFHFAFEPTEGVLLTLTGSTDREADRGWHLDREASSGLDHVDAVDVGVRPARAPAVAKPAQRVMGLFEGPRLWGWGVRARDEGQATIVLRQEPATPADAPAEIAIEVDVVAASRDGRLRLPFREGEQAVLELWTNPSTGAEWRIDPEASTGLTSVAAEAGRQYDPSDPTDWRLRDRVGAPMLQEWKIEAVAAGTAHIVLKYGRPWEAGSVYRQLTIDASVSAAR